MAKDKPFDEINGFEKKRAREKRREMIEATGVSDLPIVEMDRQAVFMVYLATSGDVKRTAEECKVDLHQLEQMVKAEDWPSKIEPLLALKKTAKPKEIERMVNRTLNFAQITRMRMVLERAVTRLHNMGEEEFFEYLFCVTEKLDKEGNVISTEKKLNTRGLTDLTSAIEKAQMMSYYALNDTTPDRARRLKEENDDNGPSNQDIHAAIAAGMAAASINQTPRALVFDQQLAKSEAKATQAALQEELAEAQQ